MQASYDELRDVAAKAVSIFASANLSCCLMGSLACKLYGTTRAPNDVDLIVLTSAHAQEPLKRMLAAADRNFTLVASKARFATYKVVWYRLPPRAGARSTSSCRAHSTSRTSSWRSWAPCGACPSCRSRCCSC